MKLMFMFRVRIIERVEEIQVNGLLFYPVLHDLVALTKILNTALTGELMEVLL